MRDMDGAMLDRLIQSMVADDPARRPLHVGIELRKIHQAHLQIAHQRPQGRIWPRPRA